MSKKSYRPDPDTLSSSLGIRPSDVREAVARELHNRSLRPVEWIVAYVTDSGGLFTARLETEDAVKSWLIENDTFKTVIIGPVPRGTSIA